MDKKHGRSARPFYLTRQAKRIRASVQFYPTKFDNTQTTNNEGISFRSGSSRDDQLSMGINFQHSTLESIRTFPGNPNVNQAFSNVLPNLMWRKKFSPRGNIRVFYRASTNFPSVTPLQDVVKLTDPLRVSSGNPSLKQSYTNLLALRYSYTNTQNGRSFFANIFAQTPHNYISNATFMAAAESSIQRGPS
jgi:hypothetical protein